jgi:hypothetical protein
LDFSSLDTGAAAQRFADEEHRQNANATIGGAKHGQSFTRKNWF